jgi:secondary thiamine-phosphate synthase enzyme
MVLRPFDMVVETHTLRLQTRSEGEMLDVTEHVQDLVEKGGPSDGMAFLFVPGSTGAITTIEYEPGLTIDFPEALARLVPKDLSYEHEKHWQDGNGHSHVKASLLGPDLAVPFKNRKLLLGTWQQIVFVELDVRPRDRQVIVQLLGE